MIGARTIQTQSESKFTVFNHRVDTERRQNLQVHCEEAESGGWSFCKRSQSHRKSKGDLHLLWVVLLGGITATYWTGVQKSASHVASSSAEESRCK